MKKKQIGEVLQRIYDSEISLRIGWLWDEGFSYSIGTTGPDVWSANKNRVKYTGEDDICKAMDIICEDIIKQYPKSAFDMWYRDQFHEKTIKPRRKKRFGGGVSHLTKTTKDPHPGKTISI